MFGLQEILDDAGLVIRDTENTYAREIEMCWRECLINMGRERFEVNFARDVPYHLHIGDWKLTKPPIDNLQEIYSVRFKLGTVWIYLERVPLNNTDIFTPGNSPESFPFYYEYTHGDKGGEMRIYPAAGAELLLMITASLGVWNPDGTVGCGCVRMSDKYRIFCRDYVLMLLAMNILQDDAMAAKYTAETEAERKKLITVQERSGGTGKVQARW